MKKALSTLIAVFFFQLSFAQLNMDLLSQVQYNQDLNDIWGYVDEETGIEYALVGLRNGVSIVSLEDPENAVEVVQIPGQSSTWRDLKTFGEWAYVVTDENGTTEGLTVIDLRDLPNSAPYYHWTPSLPGLGTLYECHNIYIDEAGYAYLSGSNLNNGGMLYVDVFSTPGTPEFVAAGPEIYSHDVYVRDNKMYASEIYLGRMAVYDVSDKNNSIFLGGAVTPFEFTHNIWLSDDGNTAFTTDERANAPVGAYDVSDPSDIVEIDQFRPIQTLGSSVIPHNVHVWQDWLIISYYTDGGIIADASRPDNIIEVGNFDTFFGAGAGFNGTWGAYPFLPSGNVLLTDIGDGLYVCGVNYVRACWLEGVVTDITNSAPLNDVEIAIEASQANQGFSGLDGKYETGLATAGDYQVTFLKEGYERLTTTATLDNGELTILNVQMQPLTAHTIAGFTIEEIGAAAVPNAKVILRNDLSNFVGESDENGEFSLEGVFEETYDVFVGAWGYEQKLFEGVVVDGTNDLTFALNRGYEDDFYLDFNWITSNDNSTEAGFWVKDKPIGTFRGNGDIVNPVADIFGDIGEECYVTGNQSGGVGDADVDDGKVYLDSPPMDLTTYTDPVISYYLWFYNGGGGSAGDDSLIVSINNGMETVVLEVVTESGSEWRPKSQIPLAGLIDITDNMSVRFETGDFDPTGHLVEAGVDVFRVTQGVVGAEDQLPTFSWQVAPNPFTTQTSVQLDLPQEISNVEVSIINVSGQVLRTYQVEEGARSVEVGNGLAAGLYFLQLRSNGILMETKKMVKQ